MSEAYFYSLAVRDRVATLRSILNQSRGRGWRVAVKCASSADARAFDGALWKGPQETFLPHAVEGGRFDEEQPILIVTGDEPANRPAALVLVDHFELSLNSIPGLQRICVIYDGTEESNQSTARELASRLHEAGQEVVFWFDREGAWTKAGYP